ncbi:MAG: signal peptidase II [Deltaproteobacteria bacterium]|nr:signal peptidase II [Deltaproteobacteria bacterium]
MDQHPPVEDASPEARLEPVGPAPAEPAPSVPSEPARYCPSYLFLIVTSALSLALDLGTKAWAERFIGDSDPLTPARIEIVKGYASLIFARNRGGAWGLLQNETEALRRPFFIVVSVAAIVFIVSLYRKLAPGQHALKWGLPLVLGGALGNFVDRIRYGYVIDFIDVYAKSGRQVHHWPTFNVADIAICVGVGLMAIDMFTSRKPARRGDGTPPGEGASSAAEPRAGYPPSGPDETRSVEER